MTSGITPLSHQALQTLDFSTNGRGFSRIDPALSRWIATSGIARGVLNLTCLHTSASLTINENADPRVLKDLAAWMDDMVPESRAYLHDDEGPDDMPAHIRTALTCQTLSLSVENGRLLLGTWQAVYLWEHRRAPHQRRIACHLIGTLKPEVQQPSRSSDTTSLLARRNSTRLNEAIQARHDPEAWAGDGGVNTEVDLLVDRLHDLAGE